MHRPPRPVDKIYFGNDESRFYLRCDFREWEEISLRIQFQQPEGYSIETGIIARSGVQEFTLRKPGGKAETHSSCAVEDILELALPLAALGLSGEGRLAFQVKTFQGGIERECYPEAAPIEFTLLGVDFALRNWIV